MVDEHGERSTENLLMSQSLDALRTEMMRRGLTCLMRDPRDDPVIVETWL